MSFIDFPIYNVLQDNNELVGASDIIEVELLVIVEVSDYVGRYVQSLDELISAVKIESNDLKMLIISEEDHINLANLHRAYKFKNCLSFGISLPRLGLNTININYKLLKLEHFQLIFSDKLNILMENQNYKKQLWMELKKMFKI